MVAYIHIQATTGIAQVIPPQPSLLAPPTISPGLSTAISPEVVEQNVDQQAVSPEKAELDSFLEPGLKEEGEAAPDNNSRSNQDHEMKDKSNDIYEY